MFGVTPANFSISDLFWIIIISDSNRYREIKARRGTNWNYRIIVHVHISIEKSVIWRLNGRGRKEKNFSLSIFGCFFLLWSKTACSDFITAVGKILTEYDTWMLSRSIISFFYTTNSRWENSKSFWVKLCINIFVKKKSLKYCYSCNFFHIIFIFISIISDSNRYHDIKARRSAN